VSAGTPDCASRQRNRERQGIYSDITHKMGERGVLPRSIGPSLDSGYSSMRRWLPVQRPDRRHACRGPLRAEFCRIGCVGRRGAQYGPWATYASSPLRSHIQTWAPIRSVEYAATGGTLKGWCRGLSGNTHAAQGFTVSIAGVGDAGGRAISGWPAAPQPRPSGPNPGVVTRTVAQNPSDPAVCATRALLRRRPWGGAGCRRNIAEDIPGTGMDVLAPRASAG
jgi:hypothetical protein